MKPSVKTGGFFMRRRQALVYYNYNLNLQNKGFTLISIRTTEASTDVLTAPKSNKE